MTSSFVPFSLGLMVLCKVSAEHPRSTLRCLELLTNSGIAKLALCFTQLVVFIPNHERGGIGHGRDRTGFLSNPSSSLNMLGFYKPCGMCHVARAEYLSAQYKFFF